MNSQRKKPFIFIICLSLVFLLFPITTTLASPISAPDPDTDGDGWSDSQDCNPTDPTIHPGATDIPGDGIDQDCNGADSIHCYVDNDRDGYGSNSGAMVVASDGSCNTSDGEALNMNDCNDANASVHPGATEIVDDGVDQDCNGGEICYLDNDNDGYRPNASSTISSADLDCLDSREASASDPASDCNDSDSEINPGASEIIDDGIDQDCNGADSITCYLDSDQDGYGSNTAIVIIAPDGSCNTADGESSNINDCNDADSSINPAAIETIGDGVDQDCDGNEICYLDSDNDGYRPDSVSTTLSSNMSCSDPGEASPSDPVNDCNDSNPNAYPSATEIPDDGIDQDCNGTDAISCHIDNDRDGYGSNSGAIVIAQDGSCNTADGEALNMNDCNDSDGSVHPGADETIGDGVDQNCDGNETCYLDSDNDGYRPDSVSTTLSSNMSCSDPGEASPSDPVNDCNDSDATIYPGATELCDGLDNDCDGSTAPNEADSDGDGVIDCRDNCPADPDKNTPGTCGCGKPDDDNKDGIPDCQDACDHNIDSDSDGIPDCDDFCPVDPEKTIPGVCGCGTPDDSNNDDIPDCQDSCDHNIDTDEDGVNDCKDECPVDPEKTEPGTCGCGLDDDSNNDGVPDCQDACDHNIDSDSDGIPDCNDFCPVDPAKNKPGVCGCGTPDDSNSDGIPDCQDNCDHTIDTDEDGVNDCQDNCPADPEKTEPGTCGCGIEEDSNNDGVSDCEVDSSGSSAVFPPSGGKLVLLIGGIAVFTGGGAFIIYTRNKKK